MLDKISTTAFVLEVRRLGGFETLDQANSFVTDAEILSRGAANLKKVYLSLVRARGANYYRRTADFSTVIGQAKYDFADILLSSTYTDALEVISLSRQIGNCWEPLLSFEEAERNDYEEWPIAVSGSPIRFALRPEGIELQPTPAAVETLRIAFVPAFPGFVDLDDTGPSWDGIAGFHEWAIWETVGELQAKDMVDPSVAFAKAKWWEMEVESMGRQRLAGMPKRVNRVRANRRYRGIRGW